MQEQAESVIFETEDGKKIQFFIIEETMLAGSNYLLVSETMEEESEAYILQEMMDENEERIYEMVEDESKLEALSKIFHELLENVDIQL